MGDIDGLASKLDANVVGFGPVSVVWIYWGGEEEESWFADAAAGGHLVARGLYLLAIFGAGARRGWGSPLESASTARRPPVKLAPTVHDW